MFFRILEEMLTRIRANIDCFYQLCTDIGELDYILSIAQISSNPGFVQPSFGTRLCIIQSYHPIGVLLGTHAPVPNNIVRNLSTYIYH